MEILKANSIEYHLTHYDVIDSTNILLKKLLVEKMAAAGTVILADEQLKGKGQGKNTWYSGAELNLTLSVLFELNLKTNRFFAIAEFVSLALVDTLLHFGIQAKIKWPNDIYVENGKIAGILIENILEGPVIKHSVVGIGLNINETVFPDYLPNAVSMYQLLGKTIARQLVLDVLLEKLNDQRNRLNDQSIDQMHSDYNLLLYRRGERTGFKVGEKTFEGIISKVDPGGELLVRTSLSEVKEFLFGEIQMII
jgi:BirA family biotin operon repressor/biotin-[acetyl-CoA-carboxylase] ligase